MINGLAQSTLLPPRLKRRNVRIHFCLKAGLCKKLPSSPPSIRQAAWEVIVMRGGGGAERNQTKLQVRSCRKSEADLFSGRCRWEAKTCCRAESDWEFYSLNNSRIFFPSFYDRIQFISLRLLSHHPKKLFSICCWCSYMTVGLTACYGILKCLGFPSHKKH